MSRHKKPTLEELKAKLVKTETRLDDTIKGYANYNVQVEVEIKIQEMKCAPGACERIEPQFKVEQKEGYWDLQTKMLNFAWRDRLATINGEKSHFEHEIALYTDEIKVIKTQIGAYEPNEVTN